MFDYVQTGRPDVLLAGPEFLFTLITALSVYDWGRRRSTHRVVWTPYIGMIRGRNVSRHPIVVHVYKEQVIGSRIISRGGDLR